MENGQPSSLTLRALTSDDLPIALPWFDDPETQRQLGGRNWLKNAVAMADVPLGEFRGAAETGRYRWLALDCELPVGYIDCGVYDRWTTWDGERVVATIEVPCAAIAYTVDPAFRRRGYGRQILEALFEASELADVELFGGGVDPGNVASIRCLMAAGYTQENEEPDFEGMLYFVRRR
jgi:RimJ/RimL family protein N-acetyltransferase